MSVPAPSFWGRLWFPKESPLNLAAARVIFAAHALWLLLSRDLAGASGLPRPFWQAVPDGVRWRFLVFEGHPGLETLLQWIAVGALVGAIAGVWPRACCLVAGLLLYHLAPLETILLTPSPWLKGLTLSVPALLILSLSRCGDALCPFPLSRGGETPPWEYGWPLRLMQMLVCQVYLFGGYAKLFQSGWGWASAENMRAWLLLANQDAEQAVFTAPGLWIADHPELCALMGITAMAVDFGFIAAFFSRRARPWILLAAALFHLAILVSLNYAFLNLPQLLIFVDWERASRSRRAASAV